jgi:hypothetical protein
MLIAGGVAPAQERGGERSTRSETRTETKSVSRGMTRITNVMKSEVMLKDESAGRIVDFVMNEHGCIEYLVAEESDEYYVIPFSVVTIENRAVRLNVSQKQFRDVSRFSSDSWPNFSDTTVRDKIFRSWGVRSARSDGRTFEDRETRKPIQSDRDDRDSRRPARPDGTRPDGARDNRDDSGRPDGPSSRDPQNPSRDPAGRKPEAKPGDGRNPVPPRPKSPSQPEASPRQQPEAPSKPDPKNPTRRPMPETPRTPPASGSP